MCRSSFGIRRLVFKNIFVVDRRIADCRRARGAAAVAEVGRWVVLLQVHCTVCFGGWVEMSAGALFPFLLFARTGLDR